MRWETGPAECWGAPGLAAAGRAFPGALLGSAAWGGVSGRPSAPPLPPSNFCTGLALSDALLELLGLSGGSGEGAPRNGSIRGWGTNPASKTTSSPNSESVCFPGAVWRRAAAVPLRDPALAGASGPTPPLAGDRPPRRHSPLPRQSRRSLGPSPAQLLTPRGRR